MTLNLFKLKSSYQLSTGQKVYLILVGVYRGQIVRSFMSHFSMIGEFDILT